jgi:hypothetical protein
MGLFFPLSRSPKASLPGWGKSNSELTVMDGWLQTSGNLFREMEIFGITCKFLTIDQSKASGRTGERLESASGIGSPLGDTQERSELTMNLQGVDT